jgi:S1-C subfamily serine protease
MSFRDILLISLIVTSLVLGSIYVYDVNKFKETSTETDTPAPVTETPAPQIALTPQQIADKVLKSTVTIIVYDYWGDITGTGSGFFVRPNWIVTHEHVVEDANSIGYKFLGSDQIHDISYIIDTDVRHDLALLQTNVTSRNFMTVSSNEVRVGEPIYVAGAPINLEGTFSAGIVSA